jgi:hypothetical protein
LGAILGTKIILATATAYNLIHLQVVVTGSSSGAESSRHSENGGRSNESKLLHRGLLRVEEEREFALNASLKRPSPSVSDGHHKMMISMGGRGLLSFRKAGMIDVTRGLAHESIARVRGRLA